MFLFLTSFAFCVKPKMFSWPPSYTLRGTWNVPYTNLSNPFLVVHEPTRQYTSQLNGVEQIWSTTAEEHIHRKIVGNGTDFICYGYDKTAANWDIELVQFLPDPQGWSAEDGTYSYRGHECYLYTKTENDEKTQSWKLYVDINTGAPVGYVAQAISVFHSHYDVYILNIEEYLAEALPGVWDFPLVCQSPALPVDPYPGSQMNLFFPGKGSSEAFKQNVKALRNRKVIPQNSNHIPSRFSHMNQDQFRRYIQSKRNAKKLRLNDLRVQDMCLTAAETQKLIDADSISINEVNFSYRDNVNPVVVGKPRDQVACGSCWAFGTAELLESAFALKTGQSTRELSVNQVMDCTWEGNNNGCQGGEVNYALSVLMNKSLNVAYESDYPYLGLSGLCETRYLKDSEVETPGKVDQCFHIPRTRDYVKKALKKYGPLSIGINVAESMSLYVSGPYNDTQCTGTSEDLVHAVLLTGWKVIDGVECWEVKNSWSTYWGDQGYVYIQAEYPEWNCGVTTDAVAVTVIPRENKKKN